MKPMMPWMELISCLNNDSSMTGLEDILGGDVETRTRAEKAERWISAGMGVIKQDPALSRTTQREGTMLE